MSPGREARTQGILLKSARVFHSGAGRSETKGSPATNEESSVPDFNNLVMRLPRGGLAFCAKSGPRGIALAPQRPTKGRQDAGERIGAFQEFPRLLQAERAAATNAAVMGGSREADARSAACN